jgi:hypothetical protein
MVQTESTQYYATGGGRKWQDWANIVLAIWLFISPWVLAFGMGPAAAPAGTAGGTAGAAASAAGTGGNLGGVAAWDAWVLAVIVFIVAISALGRLARGQEWLNLLLGIWIFIAPWVLGFVVLSAAAWDHWIVGALIFLVSLSAVAMTRRIAGSGPGAPPPV